MARDRKIGFLFSDFTDTRALSFYHGLKQTPVSSAFHIVLLPVGPIGNPDEYKKNDRRKLLDIIHIQQLDAIITFQFWKSEEWFYEIMHRAGETPVLTLLRKYKSHPGIMVPYKTSIYRAVTHLIHEHRCKNIIYCVGSISDTDELRMRFEGYKQALIENGIEYNPEYVLSQKSSFATWRTIPQSFEHGKGIVEELFHKRKYIPGIDIDAIIAFNDYMAIEIMDALAEMNIEVPRDIRIIGHDNTNEAETSNPPLTTLGIRWDDMGKAAIHMIASLNDNPDKSENIPAAFIARESCGCMSPVQKLMNIDFANIDEASYKTIATEMHVSLKQLQEISRNSNRKERSEAMVRSIGQLLAEYHNLEEAFDALSKYLPSLGLSYCAVFSFGQEEIKSDCTQIYEFINGEWNREHDQTVIEQCKILGRIEQQYSGDVVIEPLFVGTTNIGFAVFSIENFEFAVYSELRNTISNVIYTGTLISNLENTLRDLKQTQSYLIETEKLTALGQLVAGIAHEINTPIGIGITASSFLKSKAEDFRTKIQEGSVTPEMLSKQMETIEESSDLILRNLLRAGELIGSFKQVAVDNANESIRTFNLKHYIHDILTSLRPALKKTRHIVTIECPDGLELRNYPGLFSQIFNNLILNSITHGLVDLTEGKIHIKIEQKKNSLLVIHYSDNGNGMDAETLKQIFHPFFTTNRSGGGSGLGMFIVYTIIHQKLKGTISVQSSPGKGIDVNIEIPLT